MALIDEFYKKWVEFNLEDATTRQHVAAKINEMLYVLSQNSVTPDLTGYPTGTVVADAVTADGDSDVYDFGAGNGEDVREAILVRIVTSAGTTPTVTVAIKGSRDGTNYSNLEYADSADPTSFSASDLTLTATGTAVKIIKPGQKYRYLRITLSATTGMTTTIDVYPLGD